MKYLRMLSVVAMMSLAAVVIAQSNAEKPQSDSQKAFEKLKTVAGNWEAHLTTVPLESSVEGKVAQVSLRVTSMGNALMHEMRVEGRQDDPITMLYLDSDRLLLTHYCDAGNRPRMVGKASPDGKTVEFEFLDVAGSTEYGHMHHALFTFIDANHHTEDWTFMVGEDKHVRVHLDLQRTNAK